MAKSKEEQDENRFSWICIQGKWAELGKYMISPTHWLPPLADLTAFIIILIQCLWTYLVYYYEWWGLQEVTTDGVVTQEATDVGFDPAVVIGVLTGALTFLLSMTLSGALGKNAACLNNYNAFTGDLFAYGWDIIAFTKIKNKELKNTKEEIGQIFEIIVAMPAICKHSFRGTVDLAFATTVQRKGKSYTKVPFLSTVGGQEVFKIMNTGGIDGMNAVEACFYKLLDYQHDLGEGKLSQGAATKSWERAYGSYGNMGNLNAYVPPSLFTFVLNLALYLYIILIPFTLKSQQLNAVWQTGLIAYFFIGLNVAGAKVGNAFASNKAGSFQTVSEPQKQATKSIEQIFRTVEIVQKEGIIGVETSVPVSTQYKQYKQYNSPFNF
jgi:hypothetical protein